jgi:hypothetical protein
MCFQTVVLESPESRAASLMVTVSSGVGASENLDQGSSWLGSELEILSSAAF